MELDRIHGKQLLQVYASFYEKPRTMLEVDKDTDIMRSNVCWYCGMLREQNKLYRVRKRRCMVTNHMAYELTTNPEYKRNDGQLSLEF